MMARWNPNTYLQFSDERSRPFFDLMTRVSVTAPSRVVDLGCGPGQLTAALASRWPQSRVLGVDSSVEMVDRAAEHASERVEFEVADLRDWRPTEPVDVIVSNATLQWVPGHRDLLVTLVEALVPSGWLAFQVPGNFDEPSHRLLHELAADPRFAEATRGVEVPAASDAASYLADLTALGCSVDAWETTYLHVLSGPDPVFRWISGTGARPILHALPDELRPTFEDEYRERLRAAYPEQPYGTVLPFRRVFVVAQRAGERRQGGSRPHRSEEESPPRVGSIEVTRNDAASRYEGRIGGDLVGEIDYVLQGSVVVITHTGTEPAWRGQGIAAQLTAAVFDDVRAGGQQVQPLCSYARKFLAEHAEYHDLLAG